MGDGDEGGGWFYGDGVVFVGDGYGVGSRGNVGGGGGLGSGEVCFCD